MVLAWYDIEKHIEKTLADAAFARKTFDESESKYVDTITTYTSNSSFANMAERRVEVVMITRMPLEDLVDDPEMGYIAELILREDIIGTMNRLMLREESLKKADCNHGFYYHLPYFPIAWLADMMISPKYKPRQQSQSNVTIAKDTSEISLVEFALSHGCDYMDMSDPSLPIYSAY